MVKPKKLVVIHPGESATECTYGYDHVIRLLSMANHGGWKLKKGQSIHPDDFKNLNLVENDYVNNWKDESAGNTRKVKNADKD